VLKRAFLEFSFQVTGMFGFVLANLFLMFTITSSASPGSELIPTSLPKGMKYKLKM